MPNLNQVVPDVDVLLAMEPADLAGALLLLAMEAQAARQHRHFLPAGDVAVFFEGRRDLPPGVRPYPAGRQEDINRAVVEAWEWLKVALLIVPSEPETSYSPWMRVSRRGMEIAKAGGFADYRIAIAFPKSLLHPAIADRVYLQFARGDYDEAVFGAFKSVEVAVRKAAELSATDIGVPLMRKAFDLNGGPLNDMTQPGGERQALSDLFAGAIGSYKNPHSHRTVAIDVRDAQEMVMLASHLLRIVDSRSS